MSGIESGRPSQPGAGATEAEEAAWEIATAESLRTTGDLAQAATWYRRAAQHLMESGEDERAIEVAKLAAELAALDDAGRVGAERSRSELAGPMDPSAGDGSAGSTDGRSARAGGSARLPWEEEDEPPTQARAMSGPVLAAARPKGPPRPAPGGAASKASPAPVNAAGAAEPGNIGQMLDEAVSDIANAVPTGPSPSDAAATRTSLSYMPQRRAEADTLAARLPALPLFSDIPIERLKEVARQAGVVKYAAGESLCEAGGPEGPLFAIIEGSATVTVADRDAPMATLEAGDFVGELVALFGGPRTASVVAQQDVEAVALAPSLVRALSREFAAFRDALMETARERAMLSLPHLVPALRKLGIDAANKVLSHSTFETFEEGTLLLSEGAPAASLWIVAAGRIEVYGGEIKPSKPLLARAGDIIGAGAMMTRELAGVSARASHAVLVAGIDRAKFHMVINEYPSLLESLSDVGVPDSGIVC